MQKEITMFCWEIEKKGQGFKISFVIRRKIERNFCLFLVNFVVSNCVEEFDS